jgi:2-pyrone-4,6-dicarboxylate lactonase
VHVFDPIRYPYSPKRAHTSETTIYQSLLASNSNLTVTHTPQNVVLIAPSPYGTDNSQIIDLLKDYRVSRERRSRKIRAITVFDEKNIVDKQLAE